MQAGSTGGSIGSRDVDIDMKVTCGDEILTLAEPNNAALEIIESKVSSNPLVYPIEAIWTVAHPNTYINNANACSIASYKLCLDVACAQDATSTALSISATDLTANISSPITGETYFLTPVTTGNVMSPHSIKISVCGNELITLKEAEPVLVQLLTSSTDIYTYDDVSDFYINSDPSCVIEKYEMHQTAGGSQLS